MRLMPREQREAMFEIYSFCRAVDDIADDRGPRRRAARGSSNGAPISTRFMPARAPPARPLSRSVARFGLRREDFLAVIDGMEMDVDRRRPGRPTGRPRSLLRPRGQRRRPALGARVRHGREARDRACRIISAGRCS